MAGFDGRRRKVDLSIDDLNPNRREFFDDEAAADDLLYEVRTTYNNTNLPSKRLGQMTKREKIDSMNQLAMLLVECCIIVPNEVNADPRGGIVTCRKLRANIQELRALGVVTEAGGAAILQRREIGTSILLVSQAASDAALRYLEKLDPA